MQCVALRQAWPEASRLLRQAQDERLDSRRAQGDRIITVRGELVEPRPFRSPVRRSPPQASRVSRGTVGQTNSRRVIFKIALPFLLLSFFGSISDLLATTWVYTANEGDGTVSVIDADIGKQTATLRGLRAPHNIHLAPDGMLYLTDGPANQAVKVDPNNPRILSAWSVGRGPAHIFMTPDKRYLLNTNSDSGDVTITDAATLEIVATIPVGKTPHGIAIAPDGRFAYVANLGSKDLAVIDIVNRKLAASVPLEDAAVQAWVEPQGRFVYVSGSQTAQVFKIDIATRSVVARIPVGKQPAQLGVSPDGRSLLSCDQESGQLSVIDTATDKVIKQLPLGKWTHGITFDAVGKHAYVTNTKSDDVSVVDLTSLTEIKRIKVGKRPNGIAASYPNSFRRPDQ
jgi:YVTN family beta-propeller protein